MLCVRLFMLALEQTDVEIKKAAPYLGDCREIKFEKNNYLLYDLYTSIDEVGKSFAFQQTVG